MTTPEPLLLTMRDAAARLGVSVSFLRDLVYRGAIGTVAVGQDRRVPVVELHRWVAENTRLCGFDQDPQSVGPPIGPAEARVARATGRRSVGKAEPAAKTSFELGLKLKPRQQ